MTVSKEKNLHVYALLGLYKIIPHILLGLMVVNNCCLIKHVNKAGCLYFLGKIIRKREDGS